MATDFLYSDGSGIVPLSDVQEVKGTTWVALNCSMDLLPPGAIHYINSVDHRTISSKVKENGLWQEMEWSLYPDWHRHDLDYRAWMPVLASPRTDDPWYLQTDPSSMIVTPFPGTYKLSDTWRTRVTTDLQVATASVYDVTSRPPFSGHHPRPPVFDFEVLDKNCGTEKEARVMAAAARRNMLDHIAFLNWRTSTCTEWDRELKADTSRAVEGYNLDGYKKRGVLINLARDWREISIQTLLKHEIPVLYPWTEKEEVDARFACLAPEILSAFKAKCVAAGGQDKVQFSDSIVNSPGFKQLISYSLFMDNPPTDYTRPSGAPTVVPKKASVRIIDFPAWGSRDVPTRKLTKRYLEMYHFGTFGKIVVFWRHRPLTATSDQHALDDSDDEESSREDGAVDDTEALMFIREQYKGSCAPRPGQVYDPETGFPKVKAYAGTDALRRYSADLDRAILSATGGPQAREAVQAIARMMREDSVEQDAMEVDSEERATSDELLDGIESQLPGTPLFRFGQGSNKPSNVPVPSTTTEVDPPSAKQPALLARLSAPGNFPPKVLQPPSLASRMNVDPPTGPRADRFKASGRSHSASAGPSRRRSASPPPRRQDLPPRPRTPEGGFRQPTQKEAARLNEWLQGSSRLVHDITFVSVPEGVKWDTKFLDHAHLLIETPGVEARLRYLACASGAETLAEVLDLAVTRCLPFKLAISQSAVGLFRERVLSSAERSLALSYFPVGSGEAPLQYGRGGAEFANEYNRRFMDMIRRPHMRRLASMGGVFAWIAWRTEIGLVSDFMLGPSIQVTQFGRGWNDGHRDDPLFVTCDELSFRDQETLLGHVRDGQTERWVWPTEALLLELCSHYSGEMTPEVDISLTTIYTEIRDGQAQARSRSGWEKFFRRGNRGANAPSHPKISKAELATEEAQMRGMFVDRWSSVKVRNMVIPGVLRPL
ncbi:hypothetical protein C8R47DRAFT_1210364 [Mycena vitilis]|nr:hypothetical protein C8R47DRAFT_1210364 [Mycena vitilis]